MSTQSEGFLSDDMHALPEQALTIFYTSWNKEINEALLAGAKEILAQYPQINVHYQEVPGCVELTYGIRQHYNRYQNDVYIAFGCVIRGGTPHFDYVCESVNQGITQLNLTLSSPVIFGVLTLDNEEQAWERLGGKHGHKGKEAALTALKMLQFKTNL